MDGEVTSEWHDDDEDSDDDAVQEVQVHQSTSKKICKTFEKNHMGDKLNVRSNALLIGSIGVGASR